MGYYKAVVQLNDKIMLQELVFMIETWSILPTGTLVLDRPNDTTQVVAPGVWNMVSITPATKKKEEEV